VLIFDLGPAIEGRQAHALGGKGAMRSRFRGTFATLVAVCVAAFAAPAFAQTSPTQDAYGPGQVQQVQQVVGGGGGPSDIVPPPSGVAEEAEDVVPAKSKPVQVERGAQVPASTGGLPFTGFEAGLVALAGLALVGTGFAMRRVVRTPA
jgi:hypothetical protein